MRKFCLASAVLLLLSAVVGDASGAVEYTLTGLGMLAGGPSSIAYGLNNEGQVVGIADLSGGFDGAGIDTAFLYSNGAMQDLGTLGGESSWAYGINQSGQVVGGSYDSTGAEHAFLYTAANGTMQVLPSATQCDASGINDSGQVVGDADTSSGGFFHAFLYSNGTMQDLGTFGGTTSQAQGINNAGQAVGYAATSSGNANAFLYSNGSMQDLGTLGGTYSDAGAINDSGQVVGVSYDSTSAKHAFLYSNGAMQDLGTLGGTASWADAINSSGQVVGYADTSSGAEHAFVYSNGTMQDLNNVIATGSGWTLLSAEAVNDSGQIAGYGIDSNGQQEAFLLTPVPEPSTIALLLAGAACLLAFAGRRSSGKIVAGLAVFVLALSVSRARADVFNMPNGETSLVTVSVGNAGNAADTTGYGAVAYDYNIGKYDVTNAQYCEFLNDKASGSDPHALWSGYMSGDTYGEGGITRSGSGPYTYTVSAGMGDQPVVFVTWYDTIRFANWLTNGQGDGDTESGAYTISGGGPYGTVAMPSATQRAAWAAGSKEYWLLPSEDEWYKAAYYDPTLSGGSGGYWAYPTRSNAPPNWELSTSAGPNPGSNTVNFYGGDNGFSLTGSLAWYLSVDYLTDVGAYPNSVSAYGTFDQGGDVWQWNETLIYTGDSFRAMRGGSFLSNASSDFSSSWHSRDYPSNEDCDVGFRTAMVGVPEPSTIAMVLASVVGLLGFAWRRRVASHCTGRFVGGVSVMLALICGQANGQTLTTLYNFDLMHGTHPYGSLTLSGSTLYAMTNGGGSDGDGTLFSEPIGGGTPAVLYNFDGPHGCCPYGSLTLSGSTLYGMTNGGGTNYDADGTIFSEPIGGGTPTVLYNFNGTLGGGPWGSVTLNGATLYGMTNGGGSDGDGAIFSEPIGGGTPTVLFNFNNNPNGRLPYGSLTLSPDGSTLYGMTSMGGGFGDGVVFREPAAGGTPTVLCDFYWPNGAGPMGSLTLSPDGSTLYGMTYGGGGDGGVIFSQPAGGGTPTVLFSFDGTHGAHPYGSLTLSPNGSTLYGMTNGGGTNNDGTIFSEPIGGGTPTVLHNFDGTGGSEPMGDLTLSPDGSTLYGMTYSGGTNNDGTVFVLTVPEPSTLALLGIGAVSLLGYAWRRRRVRYLASAAAVLLTLTISVARAQVSNVFNMPSGQTSLSFVTVGDPGNAADTTGYGAVPYVYQIGQYDVTVAQYCQFLNAVAATDTYGLYNSYMATDYSTLGISQSGSPGSYTYSVWYNASAWNSYVAYNSSLYPSALAAANDCPISAVTWGDAARFCNWLQNGQPAGAEGPGTTESGAYTLNGATSQSALMAVTRNTVATYFIPSENEWYKAAFYNPTNGTYWTYETQSNTAPSNALSATGTNNANYYVSGYTDPTNHLTPVGAFASSPGPYGTFDMAGDVWQWNEADVSSAERGDRGGSWTYNSNALASFTRGYGFPAEPIHDIGFRVAANIPEPPSIALLVCGAIAVLMWHKKATLVVIHSFPVFAKSVMSPFFFPCLLAFAWWRRWASRSAPAVAAFLLLAASVAQADVFNMPSGQTSLSFVAVGDPGNAADTTGYGSVPYVYQIGQYDVTVAQYCQFLNAVAATDTYGLYNGNMAAEAYYGLPTVGIAQSGIAGDYSYSVSGSYGQGGNCPVFDVSWGDAARFCNWLDNGQPTFPAGTPGEVAGSTETGAYTLDGDTTSYAETRNAAATYFLPSENEWYKAAFYKGGNAHAGYWAYPTQSNTAPSNVLSPTGSNNANYNAGTYNSPVYTDPVNYLTPVGALAASPGPYGTFDQGGDVWQWTDGLDAELGNNFRGIRGGCWDPFSSPAELASSSDGITIPTGAGNNLGFRVASVPEPCSIVLVGAACLLAFAWRRRRRLESRL